MYQFLLIDFYRFYLRFDQKHNVRTAPILGQRKIGRYFECSLQKVIWKLH